MITAKGGVSIVDVDNLLGGSYDENRPAHSGVFSGCLGSLSAEYAGETFDERTLEDLILEEYAFRDISFFTWQEFAHHVKTTWNRYFLPFKQTISIFPEISLDDEKEVVNEQGTQNGQSTVNNSGSVTGSDSASNSGEQTSSKDATRKISNTPNQYLENPEDFNGLTGYERNEDENTTNSSQRGEFETSRQTQSTATGTTTGSDTRQITRTRSRNALEKWIALSEKNRNIIYDFVDKFEPLFKKTTRLYRV